MSEVAEQTALPPEQGEPLEFDELWRPSGDTAHRHGPEKNLLDRGLVTHKHIEQAARRQQDDSRLSMLDALQLIGAVDETTALQAQAEYFGMPFVRVTADQVERLMHGKIKITHN